MLSLFEDELGLQVDDHATDRSGRLDGQVEVLDLLVHVSSVQIDGLGGNGRYFSRNSLVYQFAKSEGQLPQDDAVQKRVEYVLHRDGQHGSDVLVAIEDRVDVVREGFLFGVEDGVDDSTYHLVCYLHGFI